MAGIKGDYVCILFQIAWLILVSRLVPRSKIDSCMVFIQVNFELSNLYASLNRFYYSVLFTD